MNILSFDIEEWYIEKKFSGGRQERYQEFDRYLKLILDTLDENNTKATFFCLGKMATDFPEIIKLIANKGHEIGCHSDEHLWLTKMNHAQVSRDTHDAISTLEDVCGKKVRSYRAPAFSIGENNKWVIEILASEGIERDASIFPAQRDFGGFASFPTDNPTKISYNGIVLKEFPICLTRLFGREMAFSGGGYFRFFPLKFIQNKIVESQYIMTYFHIGDLIYNKGKILSRHAYETYFKEPGTFRNRLTRYIKSNLGTKGAFDKMNKLIENNNFVSLEEADSLMDWDNIKTIQI
jgi:polysaccharide deacetylase family protein (PEP-CTERM system associated)